MASFDDIVALMRAAAEPTRLRIVRLAQRGEFSVKDLTQLLGQSQPRVSRHVKLLADAGLIERYQEGSWVFVRASSDPAIKTFVDASLAMMWPDDPQIARDDEKAEQIRSKRASVAQAYFDANAEQWDRIRSLHVPEQDVEIAILETLGPGPFDLILDLGTGTGRILELAATKARRLVGIDSNREMLKCARVRLDDAGLSNCSVRLADIYDLPFPEGTADAVIVHQVLHFLEQPKSALAEAIRVLKPEGRLIVVDFAPHALEFLRDEHAHLRLGFASSEIAAWLADMGIDAASYRELAAAQKSDMPLTVAFWTGMKMPARAKQWRVAS
jgi:ArsR family transcriptional regulator